MTGKDATPEAPMLAIQKEVESLDGRGEYKIAYELINSRLERHYSLKNMEYAIEHAENHLSKLLPYNTNSKKSVFHEPSDKMGKIVVATDGVGSVLLSPIGSVVIRIVILNEADKANYQEAVKQKFVLVEKEKAKRIIAQYEILRGSLKIYLDTLSKKYPVDDADSEKQFYFKLRDRAEALKKRLIDARCNYISYQVISPTLAEVSKELYLATSKWLELDDKQKIKDSIIQMTHSFHYEWLFTSAEEVREQYCEVIKAMKDNIGKAEWEQYKVITTMLDSEDPSKPRGAEAWWGRE